MKTEINISDWARKDHFHFFSQFNEPFFGLTVRVDCTKAYQFSKENQVSFFLCYLYQALKAANHVEAFRFRVMDEKVYLYDQVHASPTVNRPDGTFGFAYLDFEEDENEFYVRARQTIETVRQCKGLVPAVSGENVIHFSAIPWLDFTSLSHARSFAVQDSIPKISFGKMTEQNGIKSMPVSIHAHHGFMDGYHVGLFVNEFQELLNSK